MKYSLSTNWCNRKIERGEEIAEKALAMGFDSLELGFRTSHAQATGFKAMLTRIPVGSIHAFCPVPMGAPAGHPELYQLASFSKEMRALARAHVVRNIRFAAEIGAKTVVLHAGRVAFGSLFSLVDSNTLRDVLKLGGGSVESGVYKRVLKGAMKRRLKRGAKLMPAFIGELEAVAPVLNECGVTLALENLPYLEGFPNEEETAQIVRRFDSPSIRGWFDTGHARVRHSFAWNAAEIPPESELDLYAGMHLNDVVDFTDDHLTPGDGKVNFAALKPLAEKVSHVVFEPCGDVTEEALARGLAHVKALWS